MDFSVKVNEVNRKEDSNVRRFASVVFGGSFKISNIVILENQEKGNLYISMPRYKTNEKDENGKNVYRDICNPITAQFREELYGAILDAFEKQITEEVHYTRGEQVTLPGFKVSIFPYERDGSNIRGFGKVCFDDQFIVNNISILQGKQNLYISMPAYKTKQVEEDGKPIYQDVCYPITKHFREKLYDAIMEEYEKVKKAAKDEVKKSNEEETQQPYRSYTPTNGYRK